MEIAERSEAYLEGKEKEQKTMKKKIHPYWCELIDYVRKNGGNLRLRVKFKDGIPIEAEDIKENVRFGSDSSNIKVKK